MLQTFLDSELSCCDLLLLRAASSSLALLLLLLHAPYLEHLGDVSGGWLAVGCTRCTRSVVEVEEMDVSVTRSKSSD